MSASALAQVKSLLQDAGDAATPALDALGSALDGAGDAATIAAEDVSAVAASVAAACAERGPAIAAQLSACSAAGEEAGDALAPLCAQLFALLRHGLAEMGELAHVIAELDTSSLSDAAAASLEAAKDGAEVAGALAAMAGDAVGDAVGDAAEAVGDAAPVVAEALGDAAETIADGAEAAGEAAGDVWEMMQPGLAALGGVTWEALDDAYTMGADEVADALQVLAGAGAGCLACLDLLDLEILRDAFQTVGLFFSTIGSAAFGGIARFFGNLGNIVAVDLSYVADSINPETMLILLLVVSGLTMVVGGCFLRNAFKLLPSGADEVEQGAEAINFEQLAADNPSTMKYTKYALTMLGFVYLPVSKISVQVLHCDYRDPTMLKMLGAGYPCDGGGVKFAAVLGLLLVTIAVPIAFAQLVNKAKPRGSLKDPTKCYDEDGLHLVEFSDKMYLKRMKTDPAQVHSPFLFLYAGFERKWSGYKSVVMVVKFLLVLPCVVFVGNLEAQAILSLLVLLAYAALCLKASPYIDGRKDKMEAVGRIAAVLTVVSHPTPPTPSPHGAADTPSSTTSLPPFPALRTHRGRRPGGHAVRDRQGQDDARARLPHEFPLIRHHVRLRAARLRLCEAPHPELEQAPHLHRHGAEHGGHGRRGAARPGRHA
jgi:hypothetical protein